MNRTKFFTALMAALMAVVVHAQSTVYFTSEITPESLVRIY